METFLSRIEKNSQYLPKKDFELACKFIKERDFESLYEIVSSDRKIHDKKRNKDGAFDNDEDIKLDEIYNDLEGDVLTYLRLIQPDYEIVQDDYDEFTNSFIEEDGVW